MPLPFLYTCLAVLFGVSLALCYANYRESCKSRDSAAELTSLRDQYERTKAANAKLINRFGAVANLDDERSRIASALNVERTQSEAEIKGLRATLHALRNAVGVVQERADLAEFGFYSSQYDFGTASAYAAKLEEIRSAQKQMVKDKTAASGSVAWQVNGSLSEGAKQINQTLKLLLRAFNGECDAATARVRYNNIVAMEARLRKSFESINNLAQVQQCRISPTYLDLKIQELRLAFEFQQKLQDEKEEQRRIREQMREEEIARRELEKAQADAERNERLAAEALEKARHEIGQAVGKERQRLLDQIALLEARALEMRAIKERALSMAQQTKSGHVYVISNIGSFGENVYKIGMTRRLDPNDRILELGDASVPFHFDVHAMIFSDNAPALEATLHRAFHARRVNAINHRKEFFRVSLLEISQIVKANHGSILFTEAAEAQDYRRTLAFYSSKNA